MPEIDRSLSDCIGDALDDVLDGVVRSNFPPILRLTLVYVLLFWFGPVAAAAQFWGASYGS